MSSIGIIGDFCAAAMLMLARKHGERGVLRVDTDTLRGLIASEAAAWAQSDAIMERALDVLADGGLAKSTPEGYFPDRFHRIDARALDDLILVAEKEFSRFSKAAQALDFEASLHPTPSTDFLTDHSIFRRYHDFGDEWLRRLLNRADLEPEEESSSAGADAAEPTTVENRVLDEHLRDSVLRELHDLQSKVELSTLGNAEKSQVISYIMAARALAEAPEPPKDLIWAILERANNVSGIASLFVSIMAILS